MAYEKSVTYLDVDVLTMAKRRIKHVIETYDRVFVSFSGGKDSLVVVHLLREVMDEMGLQSLPVELVFNDEEVIPDVVINFVRTYATRPGFKLHHFCHPMKSQMFMLGEHRPYVTWEPGRAQMRVPPADAIMQIHPENRPVDQHEGSGLVMNALGAKGKIALLNGIRAHESMTRFSSCLIRRDAYNYILGDSGGAKNVSFIKPIYDWSQTDVFKYFYDRKIDYAPIYDMQMYSGQSYRVSTPLHDRSYSWLCALRETYPVFYSQILELWPDVATQERYWKQVDRWGPIDRYAKSWEGMAEYIEKEIETPVNKARAFKALKTTRAMRENNRRTGKYADTGAYGFPLLYVFRTLVSGTYMKGIAANTTPSPAELAYEDAARREAEQAVRGM